MKENRAAAFSSTSSLLTFLRLSQDSAPYGIPAEPGQPLKVPRSFAERMKKHDWFDPLLLQVLPRSQESIERTGFIPDPLGEAGAEAAPGVLHKYNSRALLLVSQSCSLRCRFCFRRAYPFRSGPSALYERMIDYCRRTPSLREVILSGGDPLCSPTDELAFLLGELSSIPHLTTVRLHTRLPVADPEALNGPVIESICRMCRRKTGIVVIHANHAAEIAGGCPAALAALQSAGALLLNQSVLLKSVNDSAEALAALSCALLDNGVFPYYLHQLDRAVGTWHFEVPVAAGRSIVRRLREKVPGYAVPRYVREVAGQRAKRAL